MAARGFTIGILQHPLAAILGFAAILYSAALLFQAVKIIGVCYLQYLAYRVLQSDRALAVSADMKPAPLGRLRSAGLALVQCAGHDMAEP